MTTFNHTPLQERYPTEFAKLTQYRNSNLSATLPTLICSKTDKGGRGRTTEICVRYLLDCYTFNNEALRYAKGERKTPPKSPKITEHVAPQGSTDYCLYLNGKPSTRLEVKTGAGAIMYGSKGAFAGSSVVLYSVAPQIVVIAETENLQMLTLDAVNTEWYLVDKRAFANFLLSSPSLSKANPAKGQMNIQTVWNVGKNRPHSVGLYNQLVNWLRDNEIDEHQEILAAILGW